MKKNFFLVLILVTALLSTAPLFAKDMKEMGMMEAGKEKDKGMMRGKMMGMQMMMKAMMEKSVVATSDGGVVVVAGNKITKYDKDLNVVKEAEIKMDMAAMEEKMKEMMKHCPMMKESKGEDETAPSALGEDDGTVQKNDEHASHH